MEDRARRALDGLREFYAARCGERQATDSKAPDGCSAMSPRPCPPTARSCGSTSVDPAAVRLRDFASTAADQGRLPPQAIRCPTCAAADGWTACDMVAVSSGSTGQPTFWPRSVADELAVARRFEQAVHDSFRADERRTLAVVCFALGTWVGGMYTAACCRHLAAKGYPITVVDARATTSTEILRVVQRARAALRADRAAGLSAVPEGRRSTPGWPRGVDWPPYAVQAGAGRRGVQRGVAHAGRRARRDRRPVPRLGVAVRHRRRGRARQRDAAERRIRRFLAARPEAARELFGESRLPTLVQYDPASRFFETHDGTLLFSGDNGIPLIRYHIADDGRPDRATATMLAFCRRHGFDPVAEPRARRTAASGRCRSCRCSGASHFTVSYFGANIYPENVTVGLEQPAISDWVTGKFVLQVRRGRRPQPLAVDRRRARRPARRPTPARAAPSPSRSARSCCG